MKEDILARILALKTTSLPELQKEYNALHDGKKALSTNRAHLWQKIAYRIQELKYGAMPQEALDKVKELAQEYDPINNKALRPDITKRRRLSHDQRLPMPGTVITKEYKGITVGVKVLEKGFEFKGKAYKSLTAIAKEITGCHWNGYLFFNM